MNADGTFTVTRAQMWDAFNRGLGRVEILPPLVTDTDAFTPHGGEHALDRWADDGGRA